MKPITCYVALGSNLDDPVSHVTSACDDLKKIPHTFVESISSLYRSAAIGPIEQADFINAVALFVTELPAVELLNELQMIERSHGRMRIARWGPRTLDLDLLLYGNEIIHHDDLSIPHPEMQNRSFVLCPLYEIAPDLILPDGKKLSDAIKQVDCSQLRKL